MDRKDFIKFMALLPFTPSAMNLHDLKKITDELPSSSKMPVLFIGHGDPMNALRDNPFTKSLHTLGTEIRKSQKPSAILVVSAHWLSRGTFVNVSPKPKTIHDFGGFPDELFQVQYAAPGSPEFAKEAIKLSPEIKETTEWGLDHGAWTILKHIFPEADIPVFQLSIDYYKPMKYHYELAQQLKQLREKGVLIIGSGNIVHNLRMSMEGLYSGNTKPYDWAVQFDALVKKKLEDRDFAGLIAYDKLGSSAALSIPTSDHYIPMLYSLGLADKDEPVTQIYEEVLSGISMRTFKIGK
ncbi:MAG: 4,5-DOPA dioxygenase extradiol [Bacteroidia bacterium]